MTNTDSYLLLGLVVIVVILGGYITSMWMRLSQTRKTMTALETLKD